MGAAEPGIRGVAVDAATRGFSVLLLEREDFAKGTSSRSTKLVHGGVRYLKQGNISLVLYLLAIPLAFVIPLLSGVIRSIGHYELEDGELRRKPLGPDDPSPPSPQLLAATRTGGSARVSMRGG